MQQQTVVNDSGFLKYSWAHVAIFNMVTAWRFLMQCHPRAQRSSTFHSGFLPCPTCAVISLDSLNRFTILCMVLGERPKFFAIFHCEMWFFICLTLLSWHLAQNDEPWYSFSLQRLRCSFYNQTWYLDLLSIHLPTVNCFKTGYSITFSLLFCLCSNFFGMCWSCQKRIFFHIYKIQYIYVGQWQLSKSFFVLLSIK